MSLYCKGQKGSQLSLASFTGIKTKVTDLVDKGVELEDHLAIAQEKRKANRVNAQSKVDVKEKSIPKKK